VKKTSFPDEFGIYDNNTEMEIYLPNFNPTSYEDVRRKAIELNQIV
jgi:hypothetical protein